MDEVLAGANTRIRRSRGRRSVTLICRGTLPQAELDVLAGRLLELGAAGPSLSIELSPTDEAAPAGAPAIAELPPYLASLSKSGTAGRLRLHPFAWIAPDGLDPVAVWGMDANALADPEARIA